MGLKAVLWTLIALLSVNIAYKSYRYVNVQGLQLQLSSRDRKSAAKSSIVKEDAIKPSPKRITNPIIQDTSITIKINGERFISPGDYVVHSVLGIGVFVGLKDVNLTPSRGNSPSTVLEPAVVIKYLDGEVTILKRFASKELWMYRSADDQRFEHFPHLSIISSSSYHLRSLASQELSSLIDRKKWERRKKSAEDNSKSLALNLLRSMAMRNSIHRSPYVPSDQRIRQFEADFGFEPTEDQRASFEAIERDMVNNTRPMDRLICGDVGFGKTEVAMRAIFRAVLSNKQVAFLAPTKILALQHLRVLRNRMPGIHVELLRGGGGAEASRVKEALAAGLCQVIVGTHALLQPTSVSSSPALHPTS